ncbi:hypothetical protein HOO65_070033 [Ceratocystis lukuohia]|uniref:Secreted protein n=1 Tax=Ceratocystis lukuohia TaxID=2019550 RepID=A0ABR4MBD3_9PEZI
MHPRVAAALLTLISKAALAMPPYIPEPRPVFIDCFWMARVCWCTNINGYTVTVSDDFCFYIQDEEDWQANYVPRPPSPALPNLDWSDDEDEEEGAVAEEYHQVQEYNQAEEYNQAQEQEDFSFWPTHTSNDDFDFRPPPNSDDESEPDKV